MTLVDLVALTVLRRLHRGTLAGFDLGTGKIFQLVSIGIALSLRAVPCGSASMPWRRRSGATATPCCSVSASPR